MAESLRSVGRYELLEVLGRGGTAIVYLANQPDLNRLVALKELSPHHAGDPSFAERFVAESRLIGAMNHPNIVTVYEFFEDDGLPYIAMEYLPRGNLRPYLGTLTLPQVFGVAEDVLSGLAHGESHSTIHRDLKPENLLVTADGHVKISDYGVARALDTVVPRSFATMTGTTIGTPAYMAPEQALGETLGPQADLYSLGIIVWEALAGRQPFRSEDTPMAVLYKQVHEPAPPIRSLVPDVDPALARWLDVVLAKQAGERFASAATAWDELEEIAINLLGPRWRREARIDIALNSDLHVDTDAAARIAQIADTSTDLPTPSTQASLTPAPRRPKPASARRGSTGAVAAARGNETLLRNSRRHDEAEDPAAETAAPSRRWLLWAALALAVLIAAAAGVGVGVATQPSTRTLPARTETTPTVALASAVRPLLSTLSNRRAAEMKKLKAAKTGAAQAAGASVLRRDYASTATALAKLPAAERDLKSAKSLHSAVAAVAVDWEKAAYAARKKQAGAYNTARSAIRRDSARLVSAAAGAEKG
jgi:serine/threonine protein kinase